VCQQREPLTNEAWDSVSWVSTVAFDVSAVRRRFSALSQELAFFDAPGGTQVPDEVVDAIAAYLRESNANLGGRFETSRRSDQLVDEARRVAAGFLACGAEEVVFGANMTTLSFALTRTIGRELSAGDEIVVSRLDHDGNVAPWLELARDLGLVVRFAEIRDDTSLDVDDLAAQLSERTRVVAFPWASNAVGTLVDVARVTQLAHEAGALAWVDAVHYAPHGPIDVAAAGLDVLLCSPYKFYGPHLGVAFARAELLERWRPYSVRPLARAPLGQRFETGTLPHELLAGFVAAVGYLDSIGWDAICAYERELGERFLAGLPDTCRLHGLPTMDGRVPTFCVAVRGQAPAVAARRLAEEGLAVWAGNYYAVELMERLGLPDGAVRAGIVHYHTADEVDRLLAGLAAL
jgi:cysteine desulfurase family protein (TIGR01976 family)